MTRAALAIALAAMVVGCSGPVSVIPPTKITTPTTTRVTGPQNHNPDHPLAKTCTGKCQTGTPGRGQPRNHNPAHYP